MPSPDEFEPFEDQHPEILAARGKVELAKAELESRLYQAGDTGRRALARMAKRATPVVVAAVALVGVVVIVRAVRARSRRRFMLPAVRMEAPPVGPSFFRVALGAAVQGALRVLAARVAEQAVARIITANDEPELEAADVPGAGEGSLGTAGFRGL